MHSCNIKVWSEYYAQLQYKSVIRVLCTAAIQKCDQSTMHNCNIKVWSENKQLPFFVNLTKYVRRRYSPQIVVIRFGWSYVSKMINSCYTPYTCRITQRIPPYIAQKTSGHTISKYTIRFLSHVHSSREWGFCRFCSRPFLATIAIVILCDL